MKNFMKKLISLILVTAILFSMTVVCGLAEGEEDTGITQEKTVLESSGDSEQENSLDEEQENLAEDGESTNLDPAEDDTNSPDDGEMTDPEQEEEIPEDMELPEEEVEEEEEGEELPFGFPGMGDGYVLSEEQLAQKASLAENGLPEILENLDNGVDYEDSVLMFLSDGEEYAAQVAQAYNAELVEYSYGVAKIRLLQNTVLEAMTVAADINVPMPAVDPNYYVRKEPVKSQKKQMTFGAKQQSTEAPVHQTWQNWYDSSPDPDEYLSYPNGWGQINWNGYQWMHEYIDSFGAWGVTMGSSKVVVGVIDSGVDASHPELSGRVENVDVGFGTAATNDHGTHIAGIIAAAANNGLGGAGIAPKVRIKSFCIIDSDGYVSSDLSLTQALNAAVDEGCWIVNISLGGIYYNSTEARVVDNAIANNVTIIASAGNKGTNQLVYPAAYDGVISVASVNSAGILSNFSNYGKWVDIAAPGTEILSTIPGGDYGYMDGTSMAAAVVSGAAALYMSKMGHVSPVAMQKVLKASVTPVANSGQKFGIVNAGKLFNGDKTAPVISVTDEYGSYVAKPSSGVTLNSTISIDFGSSVQDDGHIILYTIDGKAPAVLNGEITSGTKYEGPFTPADLGLLDGDALKITAVTVSGIGVMSASAKLSAKVLPNNMAGSVTIVAPSSVIPGGKVPLTAVVGPAGSDQSVFWSVEILNESGSGTVTISSTGLLSVPATFTGKVRVTAVSKKNSALSDSAEITVEPLSPVSAITLDKTATLSISSGVGSEQVFHPVFTLKDGTVLQYGDDGYDAVPVSWTSNKKNIVSVEKHGNDYVAKAERKGSSTLTCAVLDGSNKKATINVKVVQLAESVQITGQSAVAAGFKATFKSTVLPSTADNRKVVWSLQDAPSGVVISTSGAVTVPAWISPCSFKVVATSADGTFSAQKTVLVTGWKTTAVAINLDSESYPVNVKYNAEGVLTDIVLYSITPVDSEHVCNEVSLSAAVSGPSGVPLVWSSSNSKIAKVDAEGNVTAIAGGKAKITCIADDGSNKKATVNVTVNVPVSSLSISPVNMPTADDICYLGFGKSMTFKAALGSAYGKPTNQKVNWDFILEDVEWDEAAGEFVYFDWTDYAKSKKLVTISSSGKLTVNKKLQDEWANLDGDLIVTVIAWPADGAPVSGGATVFLTSPTTYLSLHEIMYYGSDYIEYYLKPVKSWWLFRGQWNQLFINSNGYYESFSVSSSKPEVCGAVIEYDEQRGVYYVTFTAGTQTGTATIKVTANDGTKKSASFTVKVY